MAVVGGVLIIVVVERGQLNIVRRNDECAAGCSVKACVCVNESTCASEVSVNMRVSGVEMDE